jgi:hypothetical protein
MRTARAGTITVQASPVTILRDALP